MAKLTLNVDPEVIERAKRYAEEHGTSVSKIVTEYLTLVTSPPPVDYEKAPILRRLQEALEGALAEGEDWRDVVAEQYR